MFNWLGSKNHKVTSMEFDEIDGAKVLVTKGVAGHMTSSEHVHDWEPIETKLDESQFQAVSDALYVSEFCDAVFGDTMMGRASCAIFKAEIHNKRLKDRVCLICNEIDRYNTDRVVDMIKRYEEWCKECTERSEKAKRIVEERERK